MLPIAIRPFQFIRFGDFLSTNEMPELANENALCSLLIMLTCSEYEIVSSCGYTEGVLTCAN